MELFVFTWFFCRSRKREGLAEVYAESIFEHEEMCKTAQFKQDGNGRRDYSGDERPVLLLKKVCKKPD